MTRQWAKVAQTYARPNFTRSLRQLFVTLVLMAGLWLTTILLVRNGVWPALLLTIPAAGLLVRLFMIQHDCGHRSFFRSAKLNDLVGRFLGVLTLTPYEQWRRAHATHHATSGNLTRRGIGDLDLLTVEEYRALPRLKRFLYRAYRNPLVLFSFGPVYLFVIKHRIPWRVAEKGRMPMASVMWTNVGIAAVLGLAVVVFGWKAVLLTQGPITLLASAIGMWLFYVQHQFENAHWREEKNWSFEDAALRGSSYYHLPRILNWFTADIGVHHIHHLCGRIPNYELRRCMRENPEMSAETPRLTLLQSLKCARLALWDEARDRLISFREAAVAA